MLSESEKDIEHFRIIMKKEEQLNKFSKILKSNKNRVTKHF